MGLVMLSPWATATIKRQSSLNLVDKQFFVVLLHLLFVIIYD